MLNMTKQEAYDEIVRYFNEPGADRAVGDSGHCMYRTESGRKCAVGCLIPDELYDEKMEGKGVGGVNEKWELFSSDKNLIPFLTVIQSIHDYSATIDAFRKDLKTLGKDRGLK